MHKKMLAVVVADVEVEGDVQFDRQKVGTSPAALRALAEWRVEREEVVMESSAQDDPRIAKFRLSRRIAPISIEQPGMTGRDFRLWLITAA